MKDILSRAEAGIFTIETILDWRLTKTYDVDCPFELQIRWLGFGDEADSWEPFIIVAKFVRFSRMNLSRILIK